MPMPNVVYLVTVCECVCVCVHDYSHNENLLYNIDIMFCNLLLAVNFYKGTTNDNKKCVQPQVVKI